MSTSSASNVLTFFSKFGLFRGTLLTIATFMSILTYYMVVSTIDPDGDVLKFVNLYDKEFEFFTGNEGGFYVSIGEGAAMEVSDGPFGVGQHKSAGGDANAINVLTTPSSFGLVQEETISKDDFIREHIQYVTPLYLERMHILYRKSRVGGEQVTLDSTLDDAALELFRDANVNLGPVGSGTRVLASYVINEIEGRLKDRLPGRSSGMTTFNETSPKAIARMESGRDDEIHVTFLVSGAPNINFYKELTDENEDFALVSISPSFIANINKNYDLNLRISDFRMNPSSQEKSENRKVIYPGTENTSTIGTYAFLVASKDVSRFDRHDFVKHLWDRRDDIEKKAGLENDSKFPQMPLDELGFYDQYKEQYYEDQKDFAKQVAIFFTSVFFGALILFRVLNRLLSVWRQRKYVAALTEVQIALRSKHETNRAINSSEYLQQQIDALFQAEDEIYRDFNHGELIAESHGMLIDSLDRLKRRAREQLYQHLAKFFESEEASPINVRNYMRLGYITKEQAEDLLAKVE